MNVKKLVSQMTLEEKCSLLSGADFWHTKSVERLGIPAVMVSDGPHGLRKQSEGGDHLGINDSIKAVCLPTASAAAASFDRDLCKQIGEAVGDACQHEKLAVSLGRPSTSSAVPCAAATSSITAKTRIWLVSWPQPIPRDCRAAMWASA